MKTRSFYYLMVILAVNLPLFISSCQVSRYVFYNFADIKDYTKFPSRSLNNDSVKFVFPVAQKTKYPHTITFGKKVYPFNKFLEMNKTVAFLIIKNDTVQYERYFNGYEKTSIVPSFSMAKSVLSMLIGCAIADGYIGSVHDPVTKYIPELKKNGFEKVTIEHLLQMTSGLKFDESYFNPFGDAAAFYYGRNLRNKIKRLKLESDPGKKFQYKSGNSQILGLVLSNALKTKTISDYLQEKIWTPAGMEFQGSWSIDKKKNGLEKTFCCINARARDFARLGSLYLHEGNWNGKQLVPRQWVKQSVKIDTTGGSPWFYQYQWWLPTKEGDFMADGFLGQYIYVNPSKKLVIVRLGKKPGKANWKRIFVSIASGY